MTKVRAIDINNDWVFGAGKQSYRQGREAVIQNIRTRLQSWLGDCFFAEREGVDWNNFLGLGTKSLLDTDIFNTISQTEDVLGIKEFYSQIKSGRRFALTVKVSTIYGDIIYSQEDK